MFRSIARALGVVVVLLPLSVAAQLAVPSGVNLHNGYIVVVNHVQYQDGFKYAGTVKLNDKAVGEVRSHDTFVVNHCCILAGSRYMLELDYMSWAGSRSPIALVPRLCNIRGIPFGYAAVEFTGDLRKTPEGSGSATRFEILGFRVKRIDTGCPVEQ